jgi:hypothetical protein
LGVWQVTVDLTTKIITEQTIKKIFIIFVLDNEYMINHSTEVKGQKKNKGQLVEKRSEMQFTIDESLNKYKDPKYAPSKLKEVEKKFSKGIIIHR